MNNDDGIRASLRTDTSFHPPAHEYTRPGVHELIPSHELETGLTIIGIAKNKLAAAPNWPHQMDWPDPADALLGDRASADKSSQIDASAILWLMAGPWHILWAQLEDNPPEKRIWRSE